VTADAAKRKIGTRIEGQSFARTNTHKDGRFSSTTKNKCSNRVLTVLSTSPHLHRVLDGGDSRVRELDLNRDGLFCEVSDEELKRERSLCAQLEFILVVSHYQGAVFVDPKIRNKGELFLKEKLPEKQLRMVTVQNSNVPAVAITASAGSFSL
jgi:hypothetical protein